MAFYDQSGFEVRCEWGQSGVERLAPLADVVIIVDVFSFSTAVDVAVGRGATVFPYRWKDESALDYAKSVQALLVDVARTEGHWSLSPRSLVEVPPRTRLVIPSANGATLSLLTGNIPTLTGCFRNAKAVAEVARLLGKVIVVIAAGERWPDGTLRPAVEDWMAAGAIISHLKTTRSPEAESAQATFLGVQGSLVESLRRSSSGRELVERGFEEDILYAADLDVSAIAPILLNRAYTRFDPGHR
jgi:2-phosphosulfolactate phosphatase